jgi:hypothetical protein
MLERPRFRQERSRYFLRRGLNAQPLLDGRNLACSPLVGRGSEEGYNAIQGISTQEEVQWGTFAHTHREE